MSEEALVYVKQWARSPAALGVRYAERSVLRALALMVDAKVGFCYAPMEKIAEEALMPHESQARRSIAVLESMGLVRRHVSRRARDKSQTTNEYELPGMADWLAGCGVAEGAGCTLQAPAVPVTGPVPGSEEESMAEARRRRQVFKIARERVVTDGPMQLALQRKRRPNPGRNLGAPEALAPVENVLPCPPGGGQQVSSPPGQQVSALDVVFEVGIEDNPTPTPTPAAGKVQKPVWNVKGKDEATASATAEATAGGGQDAVGNPERRARRNASLARARAAGAAGSRPANGFEFEPCGFEVAAVSAYSPDSREAMLREAGERVLMACGISPETSTRRMRTAVEQALWLRCEQTRVADEPGSLNDAVELAIRRWGEYSAWTKQGLLLYIVGIRKFFTGGVWLNPAVWPINVQERSRRGR